MKHRTKNFIKAIGAAAASVLIAAYPKEAAGAAVDSINVCITSVIPSMFAFMVLTTYICSSGAYRVIFRPVLGLMRHIIRADDRIISIFLLSLFGGYPIGVKLLAEEIAENKNYPAITDSCANAASFCYCISPTFALIMLGNGIFGSTEAGAVIYISNISACIITGFFVSRSSSLRTAPETERASGGLINAVNSASRAMFTVCTVIVAFNTLLSCISAFLGSFGISVPTVLQGALEISNLLKTAQPDISFIPAVSAISSMGGLCVLLQCASITGGAFPLKKFIIARFPCAVLSGLISLILLQFIDVSVSVSSFSPEYTYGFSADKIIVLVLTAMCIIILHRSHKIFEKV